MNRQSTKSKAVVGMSGGVDSSVAAALLKQQGYQVTGVFLECWKEPGCRTDQDRKDALSVALKLKIPFKVLDFRKEYKRLVVDYFYSEYKAGRTPNPDVMCNKEIKFGLFYSWAMKQGFDFVATGHYARIAQVKSSKLKVQNYWLLRGVDDKKDQSYFLYRLKQEQLKHILFPIGEMTKEQVRQEARKRDLPVADKPDSQGICFIGEVNVRELLKKRLGVKKGEVVIQRKDEIPQLSGSSHLARGARDDKLDLKSLSSLSSKDDEYEVVGEHDGVWFYTIGQRHGFKISSKFKVKSSKLKCAMPPLYVVEKDVKHNTLVVGFGAETYRDQFKVEDINWITNKAQATSGKQQVRVRIRHGGELISSKFKVQSSKLLVKLGEPQRGIAPGQSAVFYQGDVCLGGGVIGEIKN